MVRYLVEEVKAPIHKLGGSLEYPIIRAAWLSTDSHYPGQALLRYLIRRGAPVDAADKYGRRAVHFASRSVSAGSLDILIKAGAAVDVSDNLGRKPIHFATSYYAMQFLLDKNPLLDVNEADNDGWTPLLWAARFGNERTTELLVQKGADIWVRGRGSGPEAEWSALKLSRFSNEPTQVADLLRPTKRTRLGPDGE